MTELTALQESSDRLVRTVDGLAEDELAAPSLLPGWSRGHVVAHLALNAEGLAGAVAGLLGGEPVPMYRSSEARERDIEELASASSTELRERLLAGSSRLQEALAHLTPEQREQELERAPGGPTWPAGETAGKRWVEVEVHHADLGAGYSPADWPPAFAVHLLDVLAGRGHWQPDFVAAPDDVIRAWELGSPGADAPRVSGRASALAWWLSGRGDGDGLTSSTGTLPTVGRW